MRKLKTVDIQCRGNGLHKNVLLAPIDVRIDLSRREETRSIVATPLGCPYYVNKLTRFRPRGGDCLVKRPMIQCNTWHDTRTTYKGIAFACPYSFIFPGVTQVNMIWSAPPELIQVLTELGCDLEGIKVFQKAWADALYKMHHATKSR